MSSSKTRKPTILCVDDEETVIASLKDQLKRAFGDKYIIEVAESGEDALEFLESFDKANGELPVIISDQIMPGIKGDELLIKLHSYRPNTLKILLTGQANAEAVGNAVNNAGLYRYISKPWEASDLNLTIQEALRRYDQDAEIKKQTESLRANAETFYKFVPIQFLEQLGVSKSDYANVKLGTSIEKTMTVMFSDIRSFTTLCEMIETEYIFSFLNDYLSHMSPVISLHQGFIDSYIGDSIMALFPSADDALNAALDMLTVLKVYNRERMESGNVALGIGIGINTGKMILGTIGERNRFQTTVIGDTVNVAARIEALTKDFRTNLLISGSTKDALTSSERFRLKELDKIEVRGRTEQTSIYEVGLAREI
ncbi:adenylate/guanylate cyclase domain-containing response regulator [Leptospira ognonensis]|uniref:Adenylate/guanylate cyclase domain-containing response regulator n=1 Tax=Leptospira ognonensis TaxID=2484945 RepID=A0A4R9K116_9LEPT|nr:adenylate/guanylate cyclase domain-containing protein [Leptospira ognonensis]TGL57866.1 adenylate/guanylate cyclase domain-containing response regulator [Leptospira ognonensis]